MLTQSSLRHIWRTSRTLRWGLTIVAALVLAVALLLMFLLAQSTNTLELYERNYQRLLAANLSIAALLCGVLLWMGWRIWLRYRHNKFGSRLLVKWVAVFVLVASLPGALIYTVSYQFVEKSIASWFDVKVETALDAGLNLGRNVLDSFVADTAAKTRASAHQLAQAPATQAATVLEQLRSQMNVEHARLWSASTQPLASATHTAPTMDTPGAIPDQSPNNRRQSIDTPPPSADILVQLQHQPVVAILEGVDDASPAPASDTTPHTPSTARVIAYALVHYPHSAPGQAAILGVTHIIAPDLLHSALLVQEANRAYQERAFNRQAMQRLFLGTLSLILILAIFAAVLMAALLSTQLARPLLLLAEGVRQVSEGDLGPKPIYQGHDELGRLTHAFADMTQQLAETRQALTDSVADLDASRHELQTILDNLSTGVLIISTDGRVLSANPGAAAILGIPAHTLTGNCLQDFTPLKDLALLVQQQFDAQTDHAPHHHGADSAPTPLAPATGQSAHSSWQHMLQIHATSNATESLNQQGTTLLVRGALLPDASVPDARLLVCEDISAVVSVQRAQAWTEVARRLAHEIKNPLTPIQLSAERMQRRLTAHLPAQEQALLDKSVQTIVTQVEAMKRLVNEFRDYARLPSAQLQPLDVNALITDVLHLYDADTAQIPIHAELDAACQPIMADAQQLRQVLHNLLQNAQDAQEQHGHINQPVCIRTQWRPASKRVRLDVIDSGTGFPEHILQRAFEPYITTKAKGTGLGLAVVKKIADEHRARLSISNRTDETGHIMGAQVTLMFETTLPPQEH